MTQIKLSDEDKIVVFTKLVAKLDEYIVLLGEELNDTVSIAAVHGWKSRRFEAGEKIRLEINSLRHTLNEINNKM